MRWLSRLRSWVREALSTVALGVMWAFVLTPFALVLRLTGRDPLRLKPDPRASRWESRDDPGSYDLERPF